MPANSRWDLIRGLKGSVLRNTQGVNRFMLCEDQLCSVGISVQLVNILQWKVTVN